MWLIYTLYPIQTLHPMDAHLELAELLCLSAAPAVAGIERALQLSDETDTPGQQDAGILGLSGTRVKIARSGPHQ